MTGTLSAGKTQSGLRFRFGQVPVVELGEFDDEKPKPVVVMQQIPTRVTQPSVGVIGKMRADQYENEKLLRAQTAFAGGGGSGGISARFATLPANEEVRPRFENLKPFWNIFVAAYCLSVATSRQSGTYSSTGIDVFATTNNGCRFVC
jgi:hypothetical protein